MNVLLSIGLTLSVASSAAIEVDSVRTTTAHVEDMVAEGSNLWVATRGGLERYDLRTGTRDRLLTTRDGLKSNHVRSVSIADGTVEVQTLNGRCRLEGPRFSCSDEQFELPPSGVAPQLMGHRVTTKLRVGSREFAGTSGGGVWELGREPRPMTPDHQVCSNHVMAMETFVDRLWLGSFDEGVCSTADGETFVVAQGDFRMINDMEVVDGSLYIAASEGLFRSEDGVEFEKIKGVNQPGVNGVAFDDTYVYATTPAVLWKVPRGRGRVRATWRPAGTRALQGVDQLGETVWMPSEDRGVIEISPSQTRIHDRMVGLPSSWVLDIAHDDTGRVYAGTLRHGLWVVDKDGDHRKVKGVGDWILEVDRIDDHLWVGTQSGAARIEGDAATPVQGLPNPNVHAFATWRAQTWIATEAGLAIIN